MPRMAGRSGPYGSTRSMTPRTRPRNHLGRGGRRRAQADLRWLAEVHGLVFAPWVSNESKILPAVPRGRDHVPGLRRPHGRLTGRAVARHPCHRRVPGPKSRKLAELPSPASEGDTSHGTTSHRHPRLRAQWSSPAPPGPRASARRRRPAGGVHRPSACPQRVSTWPGLPGDRACCSAATRPASARSPSGPNGSAAVVTAQPGADDEGHPHVRCHLDFTTDGVRVKAYAYIRAATATT